MGAKRFIVYCTAEIEHHIGKSMACIVGDSPTDWYIDSIHSLRGGEISGDSISESLYKEIEAEVLDYFNTRGEGQRDD